MTKTRKPVTLLILDGWGIAESGVGNAIKAAQPKNYLKLIAENPWIPIEASGEKVGLPEGQMGNSEVGHMTIGAGRIIYQDLTKIDRAIKTGDFFTNQVFMDAIEHVKKNDGTLHIMGLVGDGGVHSHQSHGLALIDLAKKQSVEKLNFHAFLDGRDLPPKSAEPYLREIEEKLLEYDYPQIQTISGRYYAMDRDNRWERTEKAYNNLVSATGTKHMLSIQALAYNYKVDVTDEFVEPSTTDLTFAGMQDGDAVLFYNFRPDRARQITEALSQEDFSGFDREKVLKNLYFGCMTPYEDRFELPIAYPKENLTHILAEILSEKGLRQFRTAETEKYAHVTYFFNGGREEPFPGEDRKLVPSPKVATYDLQPEMSLKPVTDGLVDAINSKNYDLTVANFANPDMVGHTGVEPAAKQAVLAIDEAIGRVVEAVKANDGILLLTADHGNIEKMIAEDGNPHTAHTTNKVPFVLMTGESTTSDEFKFKDAKDFGLSNIAPTILELLGLTQPEEMTAESMLARQVAAV